MTVGVSGFRALNVKAGTEIASVPLCSELIGVVVVYDVSLLVSY